MIRKFESVGKTVDEAIQLGLAKSRLTLDSVSIEIVDEGTKGFLGIFGGKLARVMITELEDNEADESILSEPTPEPTATTTILDDVSPSEALPDKPVASPVMKQSAPVKHSPRKPSNRADKSESSDRTNYKDIPPEEAEAIASEAIQYLQELAALMGVKPQITAKLTDEHLAVNVSGENMGMLIGHRGDTLDALQYLTSLYINKHRDTYVRVFLDIEQYRERREESIVRLAEKMAAKAVKSGRRVAMEPMNAYERRIFHSALQANEDVTTHSEGEEPNRRIIIMPKQSLSSPRPVTRNGPARRPQRFSPESHS